MTTTLDQPTPVPSQPAPRRSDAFPVAVGSALLASLVIIATGKSGGAEDLDWAHYSFALGGTLALLGFAVVSYLLVSEPERSADLVAWPMALGAVASGVVIAVVMGDNHAAPYVMGAVILGIAATGLGLVGRPALVVAGLAGFALLYAATFGDLVGDDAFNGDHAGLYLGTAITGFVIVATLICWRLPGRQFTTILVGVGGLAAQLMAIYFISFFAFVGLAFESGDPGSSSMAPMESLSDPCSDLMPAMDSDTPPDFESDEFKAYDACMQDQFSQSDEGSDASSYDEDVSGSMFGYGDENPLKNFAWWMLGFALVQWLFWAACHRLTGHVGFRVLVLVGMVSTLPIALQMLMVEETLWWEAGLAVAGISVLGFARWRATRSSAEPVTG
jgi:hypothetical protein